jgi:hypothetical protein
MKLSLANISLEPTQPAGGLRMNVAWPGGSARGRWAAWSRLADVLVMKYSRVGPQVDIALRP